MNNVLSSEISKQLTSFVPKIQNYSEITLLPFDGLFSLNYIYLLSIQSLVFSSLIFKILNDITKESRLNPDRAHHLCCGLLTLLFALNRRSAKLNPIDMVFVSNRIYS